jgi:thiol-disulfide isomerase/thioredoxin
MTDAEGFLRSREVIWEYPGSGAHPVYAIGGHHSGFYFNSDRLGSAEGAEFLDRYVVNQVNQCTADWVCSYPPYGSFVAKHCALRFAARPMLLPLYEDRAPEEIKAGSTVVLVADDIITGGSLRRTASKLESRGVVIADFVIVLANFSGAKTFDGRRIISGFERSVEKWNAESCPLCRTGSPPLSNVRARWDDSLNSAKLASEA